LIENARRNAEEQMDKLRQLPSIREVPCETEIRIGPAIDEICGATGESDVDLVVTSTHGRTGFKHALLGSVAEHVVRYADCPVLIVPSRSCA
jgi:nucleotide-binding universal stress UspA family protein